MRAKLYTDDTEDFEIAFVEITDCIIEKLRKNQPVRIAFFKDDKEHLEWYQRKCIVLVLKRHTDFDQLDMVWTRERKIEGLIDRSLVFKSLKEMRRNLVKMIIKHIGITPKEIRSMFE